MASGQVEPQWPENDVKTELRDDREMNIATPTGSVSLSFLDDEDYEENADYEDEETDVDDFNEN